MKGLEQWLEEEQGITQALRAAAAAAAASVAGG